MDIIKEVADVYKDGGFSPVYDVEYIILHCLQTRKDQNIPIQDINTWHKSRGFKCIGYHFVIQPDGGIDMGRPLGVMGAHAKGYNSKSVGVAYSGGGITNDAEDTRSDDQKIAMVFLLQTLKKMYPKAEIIGHRDVSTKTCPGFDAKEEFKYV